MDIQDESLRIRISGYSTDNIRQHSTLQSIGLHLLPGAIATAVYVLLVPFATAFGYPSITLFYLPMILTVILIIILYSYSFSPVRKICLLFHIFLFYNLEMMNLK